MSEELEQKKKVERAWKNGNIEQIIMALKENPELLKDFTIQLTKIKGKPAHGVPYLMAKDLHFSFLGSILIGLVVAFLFYWPTFQNLPGSLLLLTIVYITLITTYSSLISLKPFKHRSLNIPLLVSIFSMIIGSIVNKFISGDSVQNILIIGGLSWMPGVLLGSMTFLITRWIIGIPKYEEPYKLALRVKSNFEEFCRLLLSVFEVHSLVLSKPKKIPKISDSLLAKFKTSLTREKRLRTYYTAVDCKRQEDETVMMKMFVYGTTNDSIVRDDFCERLANNLVASVENNTEVSEYETSDYQELFNFSLDYTNSRLERWVGRNYARLKELSKISIYIIIGSLIGFLVYSNWEQITSAIGPIVFGLKEYGGFFAFISTVIAILSFLFGPGILAKIKKRVSG